MTKGNNNKWRTSQSEFMGFVKAKLSDIENKIDMIVDYRCIPNEKRIRALERRVWVAIGGVTVLTFVISLFLNKLI